MDPLLASAVSVAISLLFVVVMPFFQGGIVGMADEALRTPTSLETFVEEGKSNYVAVLIGYVFLVAASVVVGSVAFLGALFVGIAAFAGERAARVGSFSRSLGSSGCCSRICCSSSPSRSTRRPSSSTT